MRNKVDIVNQSSSASEDDVLELVHAVMHDYRSLQYRILRDGPHDITHMDAKVLGFFARRPGATQRDLVEHSGRDKAQLARLIKGLREQGLLAAGRRIEAHLRPALEALAAEFDVIGDIRGKGAMLAIELVEPGTRDTTKVPYAGAVKRIADSAAQQGVLILTAGTYANVIRFLPSLVITDEQLDDAVSVLREALAAL